MGLFVETVERASPLCAFWVSLLPDGVVGEESIGVFREGRKKVTPTRTEQIHKILKRFVVVLVGYKAKLIKTLDI